MSAVTASACSPSGTQTRLTPAPRACPRRPTRRVGPGTPAPRGRPAGRAPCVGESGALRPRTAPHGPVGQGFRATHAIPRGSVPPTALTGAPRRPGRRCPEHRGADGQEPSSDLRGRLAPGRAPSSPSPSPGLTGRWDSRATWTDRRGSGHGGVLLDRRGSVGYHPDRLSPALHVVHPRFTIRDVCGPRRGFAPSRYSSEQLAPPPCGRRRHHQPEPLCPCSKSR